MTSRALNKSKPGAISASPAEPNPRTQGTTPRQPPPRDDGADWGLLKKLLAYVVGYKRLLVISFLLYPLTAATVILPPYLISQVFDRHIPAADISGVQWFMFFYLAALVVEYGTGFASQFAMSVLGQRAMRDVRRDAFAHVQRLPASYFDRNPIGRVLTRLTNDVEALAEVFATGAVTVIGDIITVIAVVGMMLWLDVKLTLFSFIVVPPLLLLTIVFRRYARPAFRGIRRHLSRINAFLAEHIAGMEVVQSFAQEGRTQTEFNALNTAYRDANHRAILFDALLFSMVEAIGTAAVAAVVWYGADDLGAGLIGAGTVVAFIQLIRRFFIPIRDLSTKYTMIQSAFAAAERVFEILEEPIPIADTGPTRPIDKLEHGITMKKVWFSYQQETAKKTSEWVLRGVDLHIAKGEHVALVGATGSGKTTILKLLNRTYDIDEGHILIDGVDILEYDLQSLRRLFAVVLQDVYLFSGTVLDNLMFAADVSRADVTRAAEAVRAAEFINRLPQGYDTPVQGLNSNFSAGERQLLAFARALAKNPEVLVLDEATSNVDTETESRIQTAMDTLLEGRTAIIVAHRLSTIRKADRIIVLQHGGVVESGNHRTLMARGGLYSRLLELQFAES